MDSTHVMRTELALALGGVAVFCSCGRLTGFAATEHDAELIHNDHVRRATTRAAEEGRTVGH